MIKTANEENDEKSATKQGELVTKDFGSIPEEYTVCGISCFHPTWLQGLASKKTFVVIYALAGMVQFVISAYYVGILSTIEKSFKISSSISGMISASWEIGSLVTNVAITYIAAKGHRIRWVALGLVISGMSCFLRVLPYILYGSGEDIKMYTVEYSHILNSTHANNTAAGDHTGLEILKTNVNCNLNDSSNSFSILTFLAAHMILGMGTAVYWTCGAAYLDDNIRKNIVPVLLAAVQTIRMFGPVIGFMLSSYALELFVDPNLTPTITSDDPRWIGAWWLGWCPIGFMCIIIAACLAMFPRILPRAALRQKSLQEESGNISLSDFKASVKRIMKNKILMFNSFSSVTFTIGVMAYWNFMPKYMETQFHLSASKSNLITGTFGILMSAIGVILSGFVISKYKPSPRVLAGWNVFVELLDVLGHTLYVTLSCPEQNLHGQWNTDRSWNLTMDCNANYSCGTDIQYAPVCDVKNELVYYSPCHAGCSYSMFNNDTKLYGGCNCVPGNGMVLDGPCHMDCGSNLIMFITIMGILSITSATGRTANTLIQFRCVSPKDKSLSIGITEALLSLLAFIPSPILYGIIVDWTCLVWGDDCGSKGNCWLYNGEALRYVFNLSASTFLLIGTVLDTFVWYYSKGLRIYDDDDDDIHTSKANIQNNNKYNSEDIQKTEIELALIPKSSDEKSNFNI